MIEKLESTRNLATTTTLTAAEGLRSIKIRMLFESDQKVFFMPQSLS